MTNLNITGSTIANLAVDSQQTIGSIEQKIAPLQDDDVGRNLADALRRLTEAVAESGHFATPVAKQDVLESIEELAAQASKPPAERRRGAFKPIIDSLANVCGGAGGLVAVWQAAEPAIRAFFGL